VDTGATNHMTGSRAAFVNLDTRVQGTVRFGDDSAAEIEGRGIVEFICKNGELRRFKGVYFIPTLCGSMRVGIRYSSVAASWQSGSLEGSCLHGWIGRPIGSARD
jgi:hypothetical protein